jgi:hypothetical protein
MTGIGITIIILLLALLVGGFVSYLNIVAMLREKESHDIAANKYFMKLEEFLRLRFEITLKGIQETKELVRFNEARSEGRSDRIVALLNVILESKAWVQSLTPEQAEAVVSKTSATAGALLSLSGDDDMVKEFKKRYAESKSPMKYGFQILSQGGQVIYDSYRTKTICNSEAEAKRIATIITDVLGYFGIINKKEKIAIYELADNHSLNHYHGKFVSEIAAEPGEVENNARWIWQTQYTDKTRNYAHETNSTYRSAESAFNGAIGEARKRGITEIIEQITVSAI